jgi:hypothetical protein
MVWGILLGVLGVSVAIAVLRPWRFWWARRHCPQCRVLLPRWDLWGWKIDWTCSRCGCQVSK